MYDARTDARTHRIRVRGGRDTLGPYRSMALTTDQKFKRWCRTCGGHLSERGNYDNDLVCEVADLAVIYQGDQIEIERDGYHIVRIEREMQFYTDGIAGDGWYQENPRKMTEYGTVKVHFADGQVTITVD